MKKSLHVFPILFFLLLSLQIGCDDKARAVSSCGDNFLDPGEECDGTVFAIEDCEALGFYEQAGQLACRSDCTVDTSACSLFCGDDLVQGSEGEQCEGTNLNGNTCASQGYASGVLACREDCRFDVSGCVSVCGNGVSEPGETCDDGGLASLDGCSALCQVETGWECSGTPSICGPVCGDDLLTGDESCDTTQLNDVTCESLGYYGGELACTAECEQDLSDCEAGGFCGDAILQDAHGEVCEGADLNGAICHDLSFWTGSLACTPDCRFETAGCLGIVSSAAGGRFTCVVLSDGTVRCWGRNQRGQLGDGTTTDSLVPVPVSGLLNVVSLGLGGSHACAVLTDGTVKCWGYNGYGQLGTGTLVDALVPVAVPGLTGVRSVIGGERHTCAVLNTGTMQCWGHNGNGRLGDGTTTDRLSPVAVQNLTNVLRAAAGANHTCAVRTQRTVWCWGLNTAGQLGNNSTAQSLVPVQAGTLASAVDVYASYSHTCVRTDAGGAWCWGQNDSGQLGDGLTTHGATCSVPGLGNIDCSRVPVLVEDFTSNIAALAVTARSSCLLTTTGQVWCWGNNEFGQVGDGTNLVRLNPVQISSITNATLLPSTLGTHVCVLRSDSADLFCWGWNDYGQVGDRTTVNRNAPVTVVAP